VASYHVIKDKKPYKEPELNNNPGRKSKQIRNYINRLKALGVEFNNVENQLKGRFFTEEYSASRL
jgi:hypothetical protein